MHTATVHLAAGTDVRALGGAVTLLLCGSWEHAPPCPLAPHHTDVAVDDGVADVRVVFVVEPEREQEVRGLIEAALSRGELVTPDGTTARWTLAGAAPDELTDGERDLSDRLAAGG